MRNYKILSEIFFLLMIFLLFKVPTYAGHVDFDGNGGFDFNSNINVPMPSNPTPAPSSESGYSSQSSSSTYTKQKTYTNHSSGSGLLTPQMRNDIVNSVYNDIVAKARQKALEEQRLAEEKRKQDEARKKKDAQDFLKDCLGTTPKIDKPDATIKPLDDYDPKRTLKGSNVPPIGQTNNQANSVIKLPAMPPMNTPEAKGATASVDSKNPNPYTPAKTEGELREMYFNADREIMQCANGNKECSTEYVKSLQIKRLAAEQGLTVNYNYKEVNGQFIKKPY